MDSRLKALLQIARDRSHEEDDLYPEDEEDTMLSSVDKMKKSGFSLQQIAGYYHVVASYPNETARFLVGGSQRGLRFESARVLRETVNVDRYNISDETVNSVERDWGETPNSKLIGQAVSQVVSGDSVLLPEQPTFKRVSREALEEAIKIYPKLDVLLEDNLPQQVADAMVDEAVALEFLGSVEVEDPQEFENFAETIVPTPEENPERGLSYHTSVVVGPEDLKDVVKLKKEFPNQRFAYSPEITGVERYTVPYKVGDKLYNVEKREPRPFISKQLKNILREQNRPLLFWFYNYPRVRGRIINKINKMGLMADSTYRNRVERYQKMLAPVLKVAKPSGKKSKDLAFCEIYARELVAFRDKTEAQVWNELDFKDSHEGYLDLLGKQTKGNRFTKTLGNVLRERDHTLDGLAMRVFCGIYGLKQDDPNIYLYVIYTMSKMLGQIKVDTNGNFGWH
jgi:hypothetical protein